MLIPQDKVLQKCLNLLMKNGKKQKACHVFNKTLRRLEKLDPKTSKNLRPFDPAPEQQPVLEKAAKHVWTSTAWQAGRPFHMFYQALAHVSPLFELKKIRLSGTTQQVPSPLSKFHQDRYALQWLVQTARTKHRNYSKSLFKTNTGSSTKKAKHPLDLFLTREIFDAFLKQGDVLKRRNELHKLAEANQTLYKYRWW